MSSRAIARTRGGHSQVWTFAVIWTVVMAGTTPWLFDMPQGAEAALAVLQLTVCCAGIAHSLRAPFRPLLCLFFTFNLCWLGLASVYQLSHGLAAWGDSGITQDSADVIRAQVLNLIAVSAFFVGYVMRGFRKPAPETETETATTAPAGRLSTEDIKRRMRFAVGLVTVSVLLLPVVIAKAGGLATLFSSRGGLNNAEVAAGVGTSAGGGGVALVKIVPGTTALLAALLVISVIRATRGREPVTRMRWAILGVAVLLTVVFANPFANTRYIFIDAFGSLAFLALSPRRLRAGWAVFLIAIMALLVAYPLANVFRQGINSSTGVSYASSHELASDDFDGFQQIVNSEIFVHDQGHSFGRYTLSAALVFVPRSVWHSKATPASINVASNRNYSFTNLSLPIQAELFIDFGLGGMALLMLVLGRFWARLDAAWGAGGHWEVVVAYLTLAQLGVIRGPLGSLSPVYGLATVLLLIAIGRPWSVRGRLSRRRQARPMVTARQRRLRARRPGRRVPASAGLGEA